MSPADCCPYCRDLRCAHDCLVGGRILPSTPPMAIRRVTCLTETWSRGPWRCEYWKAEDGRGAAVLSLGPEIIVSRIVSSIEEMTDIALIWAQGVEQRPTPPPTSFGAFRATTTTEVS